ncbi:sugar phosphate isomerase/epimerase family protein [Nevskia soli]|uniref:sugar phosphate isomerase/epimerase family protein n=1 Tax=Nevskia soli TaxID=418856 RepID=UPI0015D7C53D|nr:TIM barrel protein [Nevskia soli]
MLTRRDFHRAAVGSLAALPALAQKGEPVMPAEIAPAAVVIGVQTYSFRDRSLEDAIKAMNSIGLRECELFQGHIEPKLHGAELMKWRETASLGPLREVRVKLDAAGVELYAFNYSFRPDWTDRAIEHGFEMAKALGTDKITASSTVPTVDRIDKYARQYQIYVGMHGHSNPAAGEFASPESFAAAMQGHSKYICVNLDIGHFTAAGYDAVDYLKQHHDRILTLHLKDRKKNDGDNVPFGEGDTPIRQVLLTLKQKGWSIPANIEYEYKGADTVAEVRRCYEYCRKIVD